MTDLREDGAAALDWAARYLDRVGDLPVLARVQPGDVRRQLPPAPPEEAEPFAAVLRDLDEIILPACTHWQHPRFLAYFPSSASEPGILAELLAATLNQIAFLWRTSPASTELELHVLGWLADLLGLPAGWHGHIEDTASTSTLTALATARHATGRGVVVCSEHAHSSVDKAARLLGLDLRKVATDRRHALDRDLLADALRPGDVAAVVATVGTTSSGAVDPVAAIADLARAAGAWLHVDAAWAGTSWVCPELRETQAGVELADSLVVNPHKWLTTPMDCSAFWTSRPDAVRDAFSLVPEYLRTTDDVDSLSEYGPALGRRFRSLKLWAVIRCHGRRGLQELVREHVRLARIVEELAEATPGWELAAPRSLALVCLRRVASDEENLRILAAANESGQLFLSHTKLDGRVALRLAIGNPRTSEEDVRLAWDALCAAASG